LEKHGVPATFFVPGYDAEQDPDTVKEIDRRGFEVAAHGYLHEAWDLEARGGKAPAAKPTASCRISSASR
jgi:peptidoglycan/xylan/chitin deacetylase (PgdA/CDA1 family)